MTVGISKEAFPARKCATEAKRLNKTNAPVFDFKDDTIEPKESLVPKIREHCSQNGIER